VLLLDTRTGKVERRLHPGWYVAALTFSPRGDLLAASGGDPNGAQYSVVWDARTGEQLWRHEVPSQSSLASFSGDGRLYAVGNSDGRVFVFRARSGRPVGTPFVGDAGYVFSVSFDPRRGIVAVTGTDGVVTLADPVTGTTFGSPLVSPSEAWSTGAWSPDGSEYVIVGNNGIGNVWDMSPRDWAGRACRTAGRSLTRREWRQFLPDRPYDPAC
jgi:WD40 repeat protein